MLLTIFHFNYTSADDENDNKKFRIHLRIHLRKRIRGHVGKFIFTDSTSSYQDVKEHFKSRNILQIF